MIDYYDILQIEPSATIAEIKKAYRRQAFLYHPDKTNNDKEAQAHFTLIKEAYETLTTPALRENYLQQRWLQKAYNQPFQNKIIVPSDVLKTLLTLNSKMISVDEYRMDKTGLKENLSYILNDANIDVLNNFNDENTNNEIIKLSLLIIPKLQPADQATIVDQLDKINLKTVSTLYRYLKQLKQQILWNRLKYIFIIIVIVTLCILIWLSN